MNEGIPTDVLHLILAYLTNDILSICRLEMTCKRNRDEIRLQKGIFEEILQAIWTRGDRMIDDPRQEVERRCRLDVTAKKCILGMAHDLRQEVGESDISMNSFHGIGQAWEHVNWKVLLQLRSNVNDALKGMANAPVDGSNTDLLQRNMRRFLAMSALVTIHILDCLNDWKNIAMIEPHEDNRDLTTERFALLAAKAQMSPPEILNETTPIEESISKQLDKIASLCRERINNESLMIDKISTLNLIFFEELGFSGNQEDYYNYRNSLLNHALEKKKAIPITLAIMYNCIARRLSLKVDLIGLPGHLVLGFFDDLTGKQRYIDVFHAGKLLDLENCQAIAASYGSDWHPNFVRPLNSSQVFTRILNNISNCHGQTNATSHFRESLSVNSQLLMLLHQRPHVAASLLQRFSQDFPLTMSLEVLKLYDLLAEDEEIQQYPE